MRGVLSFSGPGVCGVGKRVFAGCWWAVLWAGGGGVWAQETAEDVAAARTVAVESVVTDPEIQARLSRIMEATGWFEPVEVRVDQGVVFLGGMTGSATHREWAGRLAGNTEDVVAVVNQIEVSEGTLLDLAPAWSEVRAIGAGAVRMLPLLVTGALLLVVTWIATKAVSRGAGRVLSRRMQSPLLRSVVARAIAVPVFLLGLYLVLKVSGLTRLAVTVLGGTGLLGLVIGFAFRDIAENFLASILISMQRPFKGGDLIEVAGFKGYVQSVNTRSTLLMQVDGNHVQIPNATIYKGTIVNFTANPRSRFEFVVGIGYDDSISGAQAVAMKVLENHPAVMKDPEPLVLVDTLGAATINLSVLFWVDISKYSGLKVRSAVIRLTKRAFDQAGISMPDEAREVVFPQGVPVHMVEGGAGERGSPAAHTASRATPVSRRPEADDSAATEAEGGLENDAEDIERQARTAREPESGQNLLES